MAPKPSNKWFAATPSTDYIFKALTDGTVANMTGGRIPKMNAQQAAGLIGSWLIETGRRGLENLDVVEAGTGQGRGLSQYTGVRRGPYDQAVSAARAAGQNPNSAQWQVQYFAREYLNKDLIGWTKVFENAPSNLKSAAEYAKYYTGSAASGTGYFRPGTPHWDRRMQAAEEVFRHYSGSKTAAPAQGQGQMSPIFDPMKGVKAVYGLQSAKDAGLAIVTERAPNKPSAAADFLTIQPGDFSGPTRHVDQSLPGLNDIAQAAIGNIGRQISGSGDRYGNKTFSPGFNVASINNRSYNSSLDLGSDLSIRSSPSYTAATNSGYTWSSTSSATNSWRSGFGIQ